MYQYSNEKKTEKNKKVNVIRQSLNSTREALDFQPSLCIATAVIFYVGNWTIQVQLLKRFCR